LDRFVFDFCNILEKNKIRYVVVSGYVAIVFGRSRNTEDIDILIEHIDFEDFEKLWKILIKKYTCLNTKNVKSAYFDYLLNKTAIRFSEKSNFIPNIEFKFLKDEKDAYCLKNAVELRINKRRIFISPIELQIAYKLALGSIKDIEDARFLFKLFEEDIDKKELDFWIRSFKIRKQIREQLSE
jgi:hypothetical protein